MKHEITAAKPAGGYCLVGLGQLEAVWKGYRDRVLGIADLRVYVAALEFMARRCGKPAVVDLGELGALVGGKVRGTSLRKLVGLGLLASDGPVLRQGTRTGRLVPVPRRMLRYLAGCRRPSLFACVLVHLGRCLFYRQGTCVSGGRVKTGDHARECGVDLRRFKAARATLVRIGWLERVVLPAWTERRHGGCYRINLDWDGAPDGAREAPGLGAERTGSRDRDPSRAVAGRLVEGRDHDPDAAVTAPCEDLAELPAQEPVHRADPQQPQPRGGAKLPLQEGEERVQIATPIQNKDLPPGLNNQKPSLRGVSVQDLRETDRTLLLHRQAVAAGLAADSEDGRLKVVAAAEHALAVATTNAPGLFATLLRKGLYRYVTADDEDAARRRLRAHLYPAGCFARGGQAVPAPPSPLKATPENPDVALARQLRVEALKVGYRGDLFPLVQQKGWTRARWEAATACGRPS